MTPPSVSSRTHARPDGHVLITGGAGFIGSHLTERLLADGHRVTVLDNFSTAGARNLEQVADHPGLRVVSGDVTDPSLVAALAGGASTIVHLAAAVGVRLIIDDPVGTIETNIHGTETVLRAAYHTGSRVLVASTSEVYGKGVRFPLAETDDVVLGPTSRSRWAYAASKMIDEFYSFAFHEQYGVEAIPFRLFNTVGARQTGRYGMVIPNLVRQALAGEPLTVFGDGTQRRCFCDVRDVIRALAALVQRDEVPDRRLQHREHRGDVDPRPGRAGALGHRLHLADPTRAVRGRLPGGLRGHGASCARHHQDPVVDRLEPDPSARRHHRVRRRTTSAPLPMPVPTES